MWLIDVKTYTLRFFGGDADGSYAILSHTWEDDEVSFQAFQDLETARQKKGFRKIQWTCEQAKRDSLGFAWVDTCCIDKNSSAELQEAINSMFRWYQGASVCYAYLADVPPSITVHQRELAFEASRWFTRGWTLQELIAPPRLSFYDSEWDFIGTRLSCPDSVSRRTWIPVELLRRTSRIGQPEHSFDIATELDYYSVAQRLSWAARRETSRVEDRAYSLLGLFGVSMPLLYGEGKRAFRRLQQEILREINDFSILAWHGDHGTLLAESPQAFAESRTIVNDLEPGDQREVTLVNLGLKITQPLGPASSLPPRMSELVRLTPQSPKKSMFVVLACHDTQDSTAMLALSVHQIRPDSSPEALVYEHNDTPGIITLSPGSCSFPGFARLLSVDLLDACLVTVPKPLLIRYEQLPLNDEPKWRRLSREQKIWIRFWSKRGGTSQCLIRDYPDRFWDRNTRSDLWYNSTNLFFSPRPAFKLCSKTPTYATAAYASVRVDNESSAETKVLLVVAWDLGYSFFPATNVRLFVQHYPTPEAPGQSVVLQAIRSVTKRRCVAPEDVQLGDRNWKITMTPLRHARCEFVVFNIEI